MKNRLLILAIAWVSLATWQAPKAMADTENLFFSQVYLNGVTPEDVISTGPTGQTILATGSLSAQYTEPWWNSSAAGDTYYVNILNSSNVLIDRVIAELGANSTTFIIQTGSAITPTSSLPGNLIPPPPPGSPQTATGGEITLVSGGAMTDSAGSIAVDAYFYGPADVAVPIPATLWLFGPGLAGLFVFKRKYLG